MDTKISIILTQNVYVLTKPSPWTDMTQGQFLGLPSPKLVA